MKPVSIAIAKLTFAQRRKSCRKLLLQDARLVKLSVKNSCQSSPVLSLSQEEVIINSSRPNVKKNFNFFNCHVNIQ